MTVHKETNVIPKDNVRQRPKQIILNIDIIIPTFNEADCIEYVLCDVINVQQYSWFKIQNIYVISDTSTDKTDDIVKQVASRDNRVKLINKSLRKGKQDSINLALSITKADIAIIVDADIRLANKLSIAKLIECFRDDKVAVVQGGLVRIKPRFTANPVKFAAYFDWILADKIRKQKTMSWWTIDGRVMALSRDFYRNLRLPLSLADDQFIFYSCIQQNRRFVWAEDATFIYGPPQSISDFCHQWSRYFFYTNNSVHYFGKDLINNKMNVPALWRTIASSIIRHPICGLTWLFYYSMSKIVYAMRLDFKKYRRGLFWTKSKPIQKIQPNLSQI